MTAVMHGDDDDGEGIGYAKNPQLQALVRKHEARGKRGPAAPAAAGRGHGSGIQVRPVLLLLPMCGCVLSSPPCCLLGGDSWLRLALPLLHTSATLLSTG